MPTELIKKHKPACTHPEYISKINMVLEPGIYRHTCPGCKKSYTFEVPGGFI